MLDKGFRKNMKKKREMEKLENIKEMKWEHWIWNRKKWNKLHKRSLYNPVIFKHNNCNFFQTKTTSRAKGLTTLLRCTCCDLGEKELFQSFSDDTSRQQPTANTAPASQWTVSGRLDRALGENFPAVFPGRILCNKADFSHIFTQFQYPGLGYQGHTFHTFWINLPD